MLYPDLEQLCDLVDALIRTGPNKDLAVSVRQKIGALKDMETVMRWIANNPGCHPANINREAKRVIEHLDY